MRALTSRALKSSCFPIRRNGCLRELKKPVQVTVFFSPTVLSPETGLFPDVQNLLKELIFSGRNKIEVEYVDPTRNLSRARELQEQYKFSVSENVLILDYDGRSKFVPVSEMADFDMSPVESGDPPRLLTFKGEQALTNAHDSAREPRAVEGLFPSRSWRTRDRRNDAAFRL